MSNKQKLINRMASRALARFGQTVFVNGASYQAQLIEDEFEDEAGPTRELSLGFSIDDVKLFKKNDGVFFDDESFVISYIGKRRTSDLLIRVDLKRA